MENAAAAWTLEELAQILGCERVGPAELVIKRPVESSSNDPEGLAFAETDEYLRQAASSGVGAVLVAATVEDIGKPILRSDNPRASFARFLQLVSRPLPSERGLHPKAIVDPSAQVSDDAHIGPYCVIERGAKVEAGAIIYPFAYVGEGCTVGARSKIFPHAVLYQDVHVGSDSIVHSGAVLGADGFGFTWNNSEHVKIPQVGQTILGDRVEIGACSAVDRATLGATIIGDGSKIDNLVQIAHNAHIGKHNVIAAQAGISGSTETGDRCILAGQTATVDHVKISHDVTLTARAAASKDIEKPGVYRGAPATAYGDQLRIEAAQRKLPELLKRVLELEARVAELEAQDD